MKKFITVISLQSPRGLQKVRYDDLGNPMLAFGEPCAFPILHVMNNVIEAGEAVTLVPIRLINGDVKAGRNVDDNYDAFLQAVDALAAQKGFTYTVERIELPQSHTQSVHIQYFKALIAKMNPLVQLYCDLTFGEKPMSIVLFMALEYARLTKAYAEIGAIIYGQLRDHATGTGACIYDVTNLFHINSLMVQAAAMDTPEQAEAYVRLALDLDAPQEGS